MLKLLDRLVYVPVTDVEAPAGPVAGEPDDLRIRNLLDDPFLRRAMELPLHPPAPADVRPPAAGDAWPPPPADALQHRIVVRRHVRHHAA